MNRIAELRKMVKLSQSNFGKLFNAAQNTVSSWELGVKECPHSVLISMADYFTKTFGYNVSTDYILGRDEQKKEPATISDDGFIKHPIAVEIEKIMGELDETKLKLLLERAQLLDRMHIPEDL